MGNSLLVRGTCMYNFIFVLMVDKLYALEFEAIINLF